MRIVAGRFKSRVLTVPKNSSTRPTSSMVREAVFNICQSEIEDARFLDLFAGSGAMGLEAVSRGAAWATFIEKDREAVKAVQKNIEALSLQEQTLVLVGDVFRMLKKQSQELWNYEVIFADPPYGKGFGLEILKTISNNPLLTKNGLLFLEESDELPSYEDLSLISSRKYGKSYLMQYRKKEL